MARYMQGKNTVEATPYLGCSHPSWFEFCAWCVERRIDLRYERTDHGERLSIGSGDLVNVGDFIVKTSGPLSRVIVVRGDDFTSDYIGIVESITACEIARELARLEAKD
jgi:hypothetical protein